MKLLLGKSAEKAADDTKLADNCANFFKLDFSHVILLSLSLKSIVRLRKIE
jgi:hypothetical protein